MQAKAWVWHGDSDLRGRGRRDRRASISKRNYYSQAPSAESVCDQVRMAAVFPGTEEGVRAAARYIRETWETA